MAKTIGNPLSWGTRVVQEVGAEARQVAREIAGTETAAPEVRRISVDDLRQALRQGLDDFAALRTDVMIACILYPVIGGVLVWMALNRGLIPLIFPLISGFALIGPAAAVGLYQMSREREAGRRVGWSDALKVLASPRIGAILALGLWHLAIFFAWILAAYGIFLATMGPDAPGGLGAFIGEVLTTPQGWALIAIGIPVGFAFALIVLATSVVSFPLLIDRPVGLTVAVLTSVRVARRNPVEIGLWGLMVTALLVIGSLPFLLGLIVVLPILGHATWHLYRRAVEPPSNRQP